MSYVSEELSISNGSPQELFEIYYSTVAYYYTSGDTTYTDVGSGKVYRPLVLSRPNLIFSSDYGRSSLQLKVQPNADFLELFRYAPPPSVVSLTIKRLQRNDSSHEIITVWKGRILNASWDENECVITCESIRSSVQRFGLRKMFTVQCQHVLYGPDCRANKAAFESIGVINSISGNNITMSNISTKVDGWFAGGYCEWTDPISHATNRRMIVGNIMSTSTLTLVGSPQGAIVGLTIHALPGCDHTMPTCDTKYANSINYGGMLHTPQKSPFNGELLY